MTAKDMPRDMSASYENLEQIRLLANDIATLNRRARRQMCHPTGDEVLGIINLDRYALAIINEVEEMQDRHAW